eukprot:scaffold33688_cov62-Phaeocystis_antarctica.AAC.1
MLLAASLLQTVARALACAQHSAPPSRGGGAPLDALLGSPSSSSSYTPARWKIACGSKRAAKSAEARPLVCTRGASGASEPPAALTRAGGAARGGSATRARSEGVLRDDDGAAAEEQRSAEDHRVVRVLARLVKVEVYRPPAAVAPPPLEGIRRPHRPRRVKTASQRRAQPLVAAAAAGFEVWIAKEGERVPLCRRVAWLRLEGCLDRRHRRRAEAEWHVSERHVGRKERRARIEVVPAELPDLVRHAPGKLAGVHRLRLEVRAFWPDPNEDIAGAQLCCWCQCVAPPPVTVARAMDHMRRLTPSCQSRGHVHGQVGKATHQCVHQRLVHEAQFMAGAAICLPEEGAHAAVHPGAQAHASDGGGKSD